MKHVLTRVAERAQQSTTRIILQHQKTNNTAVAVNDKKVIATANRLCASAFSQKFRRGAGSVIDPVKFSPHLV